LFSSSRLGSKALRHAKNIAQAFPFPTLAQKARKDGAATFLGASGANESVP